MKAMIFAAGLGTRLRPLTNDRPKALVEFMGKPLLEHTIEKLKTVGVNHIIVNVHHFADKIIDFLQSKDFGVTISISDERNELLDTGGGLRKASELLGNEPFFIHNVDILSDVNLKNMLEAHTNSGAIATIGVRHTKSNRYFMQNKDGQLCGWGNKTTGEQIISRQANDLEEISFTGIHIVSGALFKYIQPEGAVSIIDAYLKAVQTETVFCYSCDHNRWIDVGTPESLKEAEIAPPNLPKGRG